MRESPFACLIETKRRLFTVSKAIDIATEKTICLIIIRGCRMGSMRE